jgi:hypothetical protein
VGRGAGVWSFKGYFIYCVYRRNIMGVWQGVVMDSSLEFHWGLPCPTFKRKAFHALWAGHP